jgi:soluble lytic murein transglycosylase-like protein
MMSESRFRARDSGFFPSVFHSFSNRFSNRSINKNKFSDLIANAAYRHRVDEKLVHAVIQTESAYNASAISPAGAVGLMQLMPDTARRYGVMNRNDPVQNVDGGTRYLKDLLAMFNYNLGLAVAAYNAGENAVIRHNNSIPPYPETRNYVRQVLARYNGSL